MTSASGRKARRKGKVGERQAAALHESGVRTWAERHDIEILGRPIEVKFLKSGFSAAYRAMEEYEDHAEENEEETGRADPPALVFARQNGQSRWLAIMWAEDWIDENTEQGSSA